MLKNNFIQVFEIQYMPMKQLHIVEKIKFLVASSTRSKKQIVQEVEENAREHHAVNQRQEREDKARVDHANKELQEENKASDADYARLRKMLVASIFVSIIFLAVLIMVLYSIF
jgi:Flp pilus assembly protein TadB